MNSNQEYQVDPYWVVDGCMDGKTYDSHTHITYIVNAVSGEANIMK